MFTKFKTKKIEAVNGMIERARESVCVRARTYVSKQATEAFTFSE